VDALALVGQLMHPFMQAPVRPKPRAPNFWDAYQPYDLDAGKIPSIATL